jgi:transcription initiation factor TFIIIB Brf1 subunit/transcription initiation factor TFIIB
MYGINIELKPCPECGQDEDFLVDEEREIVTCICGVIVIEPVIH